jgi:hypothetical protein
MRQWKLPPFYRWSEPQKLSNVWRVTQWVRKKKKKSLEFKLAFLSKSKTFHALYRWWVCRVPEVGSQGRFPQQTVQPMMEGSSQQLLLGGQDMLLCLTPGRVQRTWVLSCHWVASVSSQKARNEKVRAEDKRREVVSRIQLRQGP